MTLLRAMDPKYSLNADLIRVFYDTDDGESRRRPQRRQDRRQDRGRRRRLSVVERQGRRSHHRRRSEDHQERRRDDLHFRPALGRGDGRSESSADLQQPGRRHHRQPRRGPAADLPAAAAGQSAAVGKGPGPVPRKVLRHEPLSPGQGRPLPHQPQAGAEHARKRNDAAARGPDRGDQVPAASCAAAIRTPRSTTSTTWAIAACGRSTSWPATSCARASSSSAAPCRSG